MPQWKRRLLGLGLPCLLAFAFDIGMTMYGQPAQYWAGDYSRTPEGAPFFGYPTFRRTERRERLAKQIIDADLEGVNIDFARRHGAEGVRGAKPVMQILEFCAPIRREGPFDASAGAPSR